MLYNIIYRLLLLLLIISACQRNSFPTKDQIDIPDVDSTVTRIFEDGLPSNAIKDVHHLLKLGYNKSSNPYDTLNFNLFFDPGLKDSLRIKSGENREVYLSIGNKNNAVIALYSYLDILGYHFYGPEDHWTFIPKLSKTILIDTVIHSYFMFRNLSPSYGVSRSKTPELDSAKFRFNRWKNRLRMGSIHNLPSGHYGSTFNRKYKEEIIANPEWRGKNANGEIREWSSGLKLCYLNPGVVQLYKKDGLERLNQLRKNSTPPFFINMEPPDGYGFCKCASCKNPVSDQVYGLANEVASYLYDVDTNVIISLYGYNEHSQAPTFNLHKSILVGIVPFAFQNHGSPEKMMESWEATGASLYLRDYLAIPIWNFDKPSYSPNGNFLTKIRHLRNKHYFGYTFETTASFMATGLNFYLLSKASWEDVDEQKVYQMFLTQLFPGYEQDVSLIYENLPFLDNATFSYALDKVRKLEAEIKEEEKPDLLKRIKDLEFYIEYLYSLSEFESNGSEQHVNQLMGKIMSLPGTRLLHPYGLFRVMKRKTDVEIQIERTKNIPIKIEEPQQVQFSLRRRSIKKYEAVNPGFYLDSLNSFSAIPVRNASGIIYIDNNQEGKIKFDAKVELIKNSGNVLIVVRDMNDEYITEIRLDSEEKWKEYEFNLEPNQFYKIKFRTASSILHLKGPNRPFVFTEPLFNRYLYKSVPFFFRVPDGIESAIIEIPTKSNVVTVKSGEEILMTHKQYNHPYTIKIQNQQGNIIEVDMYRHGLKLLNIPQLVALHPEGVIYQYNFVPNENGTTD